jgi:hypothetical protein
MVAPKSRKFFYILSCYFLLANTSCSFKNNIKKNDIKVDNSVGECFQIEPIKKFVHNNLVLLDTKLDIIKSTGYCGCKSALLSYSVTDSNSIDVNYPKSLSIFSSLLTGKYSFVLARNFTLNKNTAYVLHIQCSSPE